MREGWNGQDAVWLEAVEPARLARLIVPPDVCTAAFAGGQLTRLWPSGVKPAGSALEHAEICLLTRPSARTLCFAVRDVLPCAVPGLAEPMHVGMSLSVPVRPGAFSGLYRLWEQAEKPPGLTLRHAYVAALRTPMEEIWRAAAAEVCGGTPPPRSEWPGLTDRLIEAARGGTTALLMRFGLLCAGPCSVLGIAPLSAPAPEAAAMKNRLTTGGNG